MQYIYQVLSINLPFSILCDNIAWVCCMLYYIIPFNTEQVWDAITRSVHGEFNCITVKFEKTQQGIN